jgi:gliding motility-associated-like protein
MVTTQGPEITLRVASAGSGTISVSPENQCNQRANTTTVSIVIPEYLEKPTIVKALCDKSLSILGGENIEWFLDGVLIPESRSNMITNVASGVYKVRVHNSCYSQESSEVLVRPKDDEDELYFPNVITPNDDHKNDVFLLDESLLDSRLKIFNRWGEIVYETNTYKNSWGGANLSSGVYFYYLENPCYSKPFKGNIYVNK